MLKRRLKKAFQLFTFLAITLFITSELTWQLRATQLFSQSAVVGFKNEKKIDVLLFGSSILYCDYQPMDAYINKGYTSYNYSTGGVPADLLVHQVSMTRSSLNAPLYVIDLSTLPAASESIEDARVRYWTDSLPEFSPARIREIASYLSKKDLRGVDVLSYYFDIIEYHTNYRTLLGNPHWPVPKRLTYKMLERGFDDEKAMQITPYERPKVTKVRGILSEYQKKTLKELLDYCDREQLNVLFIIGPHIVTEDMKKTFNSCADIIQGRGYEFVDFNDLYEEIGLNFEADFADIYHLNFSGSEKYTHYLMNYLCEHYDLPDHRNDPAYSDWDQDIVKYTAMQKQWRTNFQAVLDQRRLAKEIGEQLPEIDDLATWLELVQNQNFTVLLQGAPAMLATDDPVAAALVQNMAINWKLNPNELYYAGAWNGKDSLLAAHDADVHNEKIGMDGGRGMVDCTIQAGENPKLTVGEVEYANTLGGIQAVVFDNNYQRVVDCANICVLDGKLKLIR